MANDALGSRMKRYETASRYFLPPKQAVVIRVDGRAFHTYTHNADKPFDSWIMESMAYATEQTARELMGFKLAYTQSDEATFLITDFDDFATQGWFGYNLAKVVSLSASTFTMHFNRRMYFFTGDIERCNATFDSRAFAMSMDDVPNVFMWRQKDWYRNSVQMLGQSHFSHKQLDGKKLSEIHDMLHDQGVNWADLEPAQKNGTFIRRVVRQHKSDNQSVGAYYRTEFDHVYDKADYAKIQEWITTKETVDA